MITDEILVILTQKDGNAFEIVIVCIKNVFKDMIGYPLSDLP